MSGLRGMSSSGQDVALRGAQLVIGAARCRGWMQPCQKGVLRKGLANAAEVPTLSRLVLTQCHKDLCVICAAEASCWLPLLDLVLLLCLCSQ